ncbi:MAG: pyruvate carboxyltransferase [Pseudomonadota bacterium]
MKGLIDSTLREGEQTPGVSFRLSTKIQIARLLARVGIEEIEIGIATPYDRELPELVRLCRREITAGRLALWCRCAEDDIKHGASLKPDVLSLSMPASDMHIFDKMNRNHDWAIATLEKSVKLSRAIGVPFVSVGLEDATRADNDFLLQMVRTAERSGAHRVRIADTVGIASPAMISSLVRRIIGSCSLEIGVHTHNDFGMATANGIAALESGAHWADATVLGLGERAGNSRLEEIAGYLALREGSRPYKTAHLRSLCRVVAKAANLPIAGNHPVVGRSIFTCETGLHLQGLTRNPATYEPYDPSRVGGHRRLLLGKKAGKRAIMDKLDSMGVNMAETELERITSLVRLHAGSKKRPLNDEEILAITAL